VDADCVTWLWVVLGTLTLTAVLVFAVIVMVTNRWPWDDDNLR
jgi:Tfp pilus assembly protein PilN